MILATRLLVLAALLLAAPALAQSPGSCDLGTAEADLDANDVLARVFNTGALFYGNTTVSGYLVPKATGRSPIYSASLWVGGQVDGEVRVAAAKYSQFEFWPGPLDAAGNPPADCAAYDRIYSVRRTDVERYVETGTATADLRDWPVELGAPVIDGDGIPGNYDLAAGDQPAISGAQTLFWVMNDAGNEHWWGSRPIPVEARVEASALPSPQRALHQTTFYRYRLAYRGTAPLDSAYVALFVEADLGDASDDFIGTDTTLGMGFVYNGAEADAIYGAPPALGVKVVRGPAGLPNGYDDDGDGEVDEPGERLGLTATPCFFKVSPYEPIWAGEYYNCLQGRWAHGIPMREGGYSNGSGAITTFGFPGDPVTGAFWSEENADGQGTSNVPADRRFVVVTGPFRLEPGEETEVVFAVVFAQGADRLDSVVELREAAQMVQNAYDLGLYDPQPVPVEAPPAPQAFALSHPHPNPFRHTAALTLTVPPGAGPVRLAVFDVLGREVAVLADGPLAPGEHVLTLDGAALPAGLYLVRLQAARDSRTLRVVHVE